MAWLGEGLSSLSNLKGQITNFSKEFLSDGIITDNVTPSTDLDEANAKCLQLQELLNSKEAEISILRKQNSELQKAVVEFRQKPSDSCKNNEEKEEDEFFWDPPRNTSNRVSQTKQLQDQLEKATVRIKDLESELNRLQTLNSSNVKDNAIFKEEGPSQKTELLRAKQDVMNRIIQMGEKSREVERNTRRLQLDELTLVSDFRQAISKLASPEQYDLIKSALIALENENQELKNSEDKEKSDSEGFDTEGKNEREVELQKRIEELEEENRNLTSSVEELDKQHAESIERVLSLKEELQKKHHSLQSAYEDLYTEYNQAQTKMVNLQQQIAVLPKSTDTSSHTSKVQKEDKEVEVRTTIENKATEIDFPGNYQLNSELEKVQEILKNAPLDPSVNNEESLFIRLAKQFVELKWKKETLERKFNDQTRELKETQELRDSLQIDCEDMQTNIESLLVQIQHLKSNLPSIPEASEERVASLETETESLQEEIRTLRKSNSEMSQELKTIRTAIKEEGANIDLARIETILESKSRQSESNDDDLLQKTLDENSALRRRIDVLESELRVSMERCKGLDENIELIEELKLDLENARRELKIASSNAKRLENSLNILQESKNEADADNEVLVREKEQLEADLKLLKESDLKRNDGEALSDLREELKKMKEEKDDLEYDIRNMRNELDKTIEDLEESKAQAKHFQADNERLINENNKLLDQFSETQTESLDKIELLNTEMTLLQQELETCKNELENAMKNLSDMEAKILTSENDNQNLKEQLIKTKDLETENQRLLKEMEETLTEKNLNNSEKDLDIALQSLKKLEEKLLICENENTRLQKELTEMEQVKNKNKILNDEIKVNSQKILEIEKESAEIKNKLVITEDCMQNLKKEKELAHFKIKELESLVEENEMIRKEIEELRIQLTLEREDKEKENKLQKEVTAKYFNEIEKSQTLEEENNKLKELQNLANLQKDVNFEKKNSVTESSSSEENLKTMIQLEEKSQEIERLKKTIEKDTESASMARETVENLSQLISAKDNDLIKMTAACDALKKEKDELIKLVQEKHAESLQYHSEIQRLTQLLTEQTSNLQKLIGEKEVNFAALQEKEAQLLWSQNELRVLKQRLENVEKTTNHAEYCGVPEHSLLSKQVSTLEEKNKALESAVLQDQSNIRYLQEQLTEAQSKEVLSLKEVERLRNHLVEMESNYTEEQLQSEEIQRTLEARLMQVEEKFKNSSTMYTSVNVRANQQVETLQQQLALIVQQRDDLQNKISTAEDKVLSYSASLTNLQLVLEQFQRDKEKDIQAATEKLRVQLQESHKKQEDLITDISNLKEQLAEAKECVRAASRLTEQLEKKSERIEQLNQEVSRLAELVNTADQRVQEAFKSGEGKVDRSLVKNLLLGYISSPLSDKTSVLRVFANVLDFNEVEREKCGLNTSSAKNSWFSSMVNNGSNSSKDQEASLSSAFIKFLESESQPKPQLPALPISNSSLNRPGHSRQHSSSSTQSTLLLSNVTLPTFPDFVPARNTGSILKEVLKDS